MKIDSNEGSKVREGATDEPDWFELGLVALQRAALKAREVAIQAGTPIVIWRDGRVVEADPRTGLEISKVTRAVSNES